MSTFKKCRCLLLPTKEKAKDTDLSIVPESKIRLDNKGILSFEPHVKGLYYNGLIHTYQHLYILSDDEIKEGDWFTDLVHIYQCKYNIGDGLGIIDKLPMSIRKRGCYKVIASTDSSLTIRVEDGFNNKYYRPMCSPSQSFIEKYVEEYNKGNKIEEVMVGSPHRGCNRFMGPKISKKLWSRSWKDLTKKRKQWQ